jgi:Na+/proline symporter
VGVQFFLFSLIGLLLWNVHDGQTIQQLGYAAPDELFPRFIVSGLPAGMSGLLLAGIVAAAMSTLSSSLNALASSTMLDLYERFVGEKPSQERAVFLSRGATLLWGVVFIVFANLFSSTDNPVVELGLSIASFTYGGLLGAFLLGLVSGRARQRDAVTAFFVTIAVTTGVIFGVWHGPQGWVFQPLDGFARALGLGGVDTDGFSQIGYPWYALMGSALCVGLGSVLGARHERDEKRAA